MGVTLDGEILAITTGEPTGVIDLALAETGASPTSVLSLGMAVAEGREHEAAATLEDATEKLGLPAGLPVAGPIAELDATVPGVGVAEPSTMVLVMGSTLVGRLNSRRHKEPGPVATMEPDGILPGYYGYRFPARPLGDELDRLEDFLASDAQTLGDAAAELDPGADGLIWPPDGPIIGLKPDHGRAHLYRARLEAIAFDLRLAVEQMRDAGVPVRRFVVTGPRAHRHPALVRIFADILGERIGIHPGEHPALLGAAVRGVLAAGGDATGFPTPSTAIKAMARPDDAPLQRPDRQAAAAYNTAFNRYRELTGPPGADNAVP